MSTKISSQSFSKMGQQQGASMPAIIVFLGMAAVILTVAFKLYPAIYEQWQVESVLNSFKEEKGLDDQSVRDIEKKFNSRLITNNVRNFDFKESVFITMEENILSIEVEYENRINIYKNIDAVVKFQENLEIGY